MINVQCLFKNIHNYVTWLRQQSIRLDTPELMAQVRSVFNEAAPTEANSASIDRYVRALRSLLSCETLPEQFSVTNGVHVPCYNIGDQVDGQFVVASERLWFAGVVVEKRPSGAALGYEVFWVGTKPSKTGTSKNPRWMSVHSLRSHLNGSSIGSDAEWHDIERIRCVYDPSTRHASVVEVEESLESSNIVEVPKYVEGSSSGAGNSSGGSGMIASSGEQASNGISERPPRGSSKRSSENVESNGGESGGVSGNQKKKKRGSHNGSRVPAPKSSHNGRVPAPETPHGGQKTPAVQAIGTFSVHKKTFEVCDSVSFAISCLQSLDQGEVEHPSTFGQLKNRILDMGASLAAMYRNQNYVKMVADTLQELDQYAGPEPPCLPHSKVFVELLEKYGFCVTPRMFTKSEILCIAIAMLDTRHHFMRIEQKTGNEKGFRGMAFLDPRVQSVMLKRLQRYGFANSRFHPESLQSFSSVVINGGGSWLQSSDWDFNLQSRFVMDCSVTPFAIAISDSPGVLEANGLYVASTKKRNNQTVYVQVSSIEFESGGTNRKLDKNFTPFKKCLIASVVKSLKQHALDSKGIRREPCSPRVLCCTGTDSWGIQMLPGFDTKLFLVQFGWEAGRNFTATNPMCLKRSLFNGQGNSIMQPCNVSISIVAEAASSVILPEKLGDVHHYFSFGTTKYVNRDADDDCMTVPEAMDPQAWHGDGPEFYDAAVYTDCGDLKSDAPSWDKRQSTKRAKKRHPNPIVSHADHLSANSWCPLLPQLLKPFLPEQNDILSESWSALGAVFSGTFIETWATHPKRARHDPDSVAEALRVPIPLGCMAPFTFFWKHRGKGDEAPAKGQSNVPVHARPHDYVFCSDPRKLPCYDAEATLEFTSTCGNPAAHSDPGSQLQVLECLQTFNRWSPGHQEHLQSYHEYFATQDELNSYLRHARNHQCQVKEVLIFPCVEVSTWRIVLCTGSGEEACTVRVRGTANEGEQIDVLVCKADFESDVPLFFGGDGKKYQLCGDGQAVVETISTGLIYEYEPAIDSLLKSATSNLSTNWCSATLHHLLCLLDMSCLQDGTLSINEHNVLVATSAKKNIEFELLPFYSMIGQLGTNKFWRLYTVRGGGVRIALPDPYPLLTDWSFVALDPAITPKSKKLGFRVSGKLAYDPSREVQESLPADYFTSEIVGIDSEGAVITVDDTPYRLAGDSDQKKYDGMAIQNIMRTFPREGTWLNKGHASIDSVMQALSKCFNPS